MVYPVDEETFAARNTPEWIREGHLNSIQQFLKRIQDFLGYGGRLHDKSGLVIPVGSIMPYGGLVAPSGWLLGDGEEYERAAAAYSDLFAVIGTRYGSRHPDYFNVPDTRGVFLRGYVGIADSDFDPIDVQPGGDTIQLPEDNLKRTGVPVRFSTTDTLPAPLLINTTYYVVKLTTTVLRLALTRADSIVGTYLDITTKGAGIHTIYAYLEEDKDSRLKLTEGGSDGEDLGSYQEDENKSHRHYTNLDRGNAGTSYGHFGFASSLAWDDDYYSSYSGGVESRPRNVSANYIIKR